MSLAQLEPGKTFGNDFRIIEPLKHGGMGSVYIVEQAQTGARRALKLMHPQLVQDPKFRRRFEQEARIGAQIKSEHVVQVIAAGVDGDTGSAWLVMELLEGEDLDTCLRRRGQLPQAEAMEVLGQLCHALGAAHEVGIVHRDLKPANIFLAEARRRGVPFTVKVLDFGIAKIVAESSTTHTEAVGSPMWMAPEQTTQDHEILPATDVWALGLLTFRLLTGRYYWKAPNKPGATTAMLFREILIEPLPSAAQRAAEHGVAGLPKGFDAWFSKCVARDPHARFPNATEAFAALEKILAPRQAPATTPTDLLGWKEPREPLRKRRDRDEEPSARSKDRGPTSGEPSPRRPSRSDLLAPVEVPAAREKTPAKSGASSATPAKSSAKKRDEDSEATRPVRYPDVAKSIQRESRPPPMPAAAKPSPKKPAEEETPPVSAVPVSEMPESIAPESAIPASVEMVDDGTPASDTVPARKSLSAIEEALAGISPPTADIVPAEAEEKPAPKAVAKTVAPAVAERPSAPPTQKSAKAGDDEHAVEPKPAAPGKAAVLEKPAAAKESPLKSPSKTDVLETSSEPPAAAVSSKTAPAASLLDPGAAETVSGVSDIGADGGTGQKSGSKRSRIGIVAAAVGVALLVAVFGIRSFQRGQLEGACESEAASGSREKRIEACGDLCKGGSGIHCKAKGDLLVYPPKGVAPDKEAAMAAYQDACTLGYDPACNVVAELKRGIMPPPPPTSPSSAPTEKPIEMDIDAETAPAKQILITYQHAQNAPASVTRSKDEALSRANEALSKLKKGEDFNEVLKAYSDDPALVERGGVPDPLSMTRLRSALERLKPGDFEIVETLVGYHVVLRTSNPLPASTVGEPSGFQTVRKPDEPVPTNTSTTAPPATASGAPTTPSTAPTTQPSATPTTAPTTTAAEPPDEAAMRRSLEPKVNSGSASLSEMRLLKAICKHMGDMQCVGRVNAMIKEKEANP